MNKHNLPETLQRDKRKYNNIENSTFPLSGPKLPRKQNRNLPGAATCLMALLLLLSEQSRDASQHVQESSETGATSVNVSNSSFKWLTQELSHLAKLNSATESNMWPVYFTTHRYSTAYFRVFEAY